MHLLLRHALVLLAMLFAGRALAMVVVNEPWVRVTAHGRTAEVYMRISSSEDARLVAVSSPAAKSVTLRSPLVSKRVATGIELPPHQTILLAPDGYRVELKKFVKPIRLGQRIPLTLTVRSGDGTTQDIAITAEVRHHSPSEDEATGHGHRH